MIEQPAGWLGQCATWACRSLVLRRPSRRPQQQPLCFTILRHLTPAAPPALSHTPLAPPCSEIQFRQVAGDFERFQGKWMLQGLGAPAGSSYASSASSGSGSGSSSSGSDGEGGGSGGASGGGSGAAPAATQLKYAVEIVIPRATRMLGVLEPLLERTVFEDVPANLAAIKARAEAEQGEREAAELEAAGEAAAAASLRRRLERPSLPALLESFDVLAGELERCFGGDRVLPSRSELREMNRCGGGARRACARGSRAPRRRLACLLPHRSSAG